MILLGVHSVDGTALGLLTPRSVSYTRRLDAAGRWQAWFMASERKAQELLQPDRRVRIYRDDRLLGAGILTEREYVSSQEGYQLTVTGPDLLEELRRRNTLLGLAYSQVALGTVVNDLLSRAPGWTAELDGEYSAQIVDARFDGVNLLLALITLTKRYGLHLRMKAGALRVVELGAFEALSSLRLITPRPVLPADAATATKSIPITPVTPAVPLPPETPLTPAATAAAWLLTWRSRGLVWGEGELAMSDALPYTLVWGNQSLVWHDGELSMESVE